MRNDNTKTTNDQNIDSLFERYYEERLQYFPLEATAIADNRYNDLLPVDISAAYRDTLKSFYQRYLDELKSFSKTAITPQQQLSYDVFEREMKMQIEGLAFHDNLMPVNQFWSMHLTFPLLGSASGNQPFKSTQDYDAFLKRIDGFSAYVDTMIVNMRQGMQSGIVPPKVLMERVLPQLEEIYVADTSKNVFAGPVKNFPESFSESERSKFTKLYFDKIDNTIRPAYKRLYDFIKDEYISACRDNAGISAIPGGADYYKYMCRYWTTTDLSPDEIFQTGQKEVARLRNEMNNVLSSLNYKKSLKEFFREIHENKKFTPFKTDHEVIDAFEAIEKRMQPQLKKLFNLVPKTPFEIRQTEEFREASASAEYNQGAPDGSRPGIFYVPIPDASKYNMVGMEDLFLHEAIPGHHYQVSLQQENESLPRFRRFSWYGAYGEGWALYTESLGKELGLYTDPYQYFGSLSEEMHRAIRLVVDVGIHMKGWTREQAIQFSLENEAESEADITSEIERYMAIPGQALSYKIGQLKILETRKKAREKLGDNFDIRAFHDEVLKDGCLPLDIFERKMDAWMSQKGEQ